MNPPKEVGRGVEIRTPGRGLGATSGLGTTGTPEKGREDYDLFAGPGD